MPAKKGGALRHFEGWEAGLVAVTIALFGTLLAVPLEAEPEDVPVPLAQGASLSATRQREDALAASVAASLARELSQPSEGTALFDLRALGQEFRAYGRAERAGDTNAVVRQRQRLIEVVARARSLGEERLLGLRAYERDRFVAEVRRWEATGSASEELSDLGGAFVSLATRSGWVSRGSLLMSDTLRGVFFKRRWNEVTGLTAKPFELSLDELRLFYAFLLTYPYVEERDSLSPADACRVADQWRLRKVEEFSHFDPSYPYELARGVLFYRLGRFPAATQAFRDYLGGPHEGLYALRARNYLAAASARAAADR